MKATFVSVVLLLVSTAAAPAALLAADDPEEAPSPAVRLLDGAVGEAFTHGAAASASFRALVDAIEAYPVVVHVVTGRPPIFGAVGATRLVGVASGWMYLRVELDARVRLDERAAVLAHELRHVVEIVDAAAVGTDDLRRLYERIGRHAGALYAYETDEAVAEGVRVLREIRAFTAAQTHRAVRADAQQ